eukprot:CAMPEP_0116896424 /NCGR_PEP_ID=MMETSP0467-20121206/5675_1 /TAXON_ID=283647 /ORGANISM="Mesodinium pulex, Strain SPMC105" /LENGTH=38 /DNA_ID= /DNA_START= /DNA_END= /DNA_ORIENTATION=
MKKRTDETISRISKMLVDDSDTHIAHCDSVSGAKTEAE